VEPVPDAPLFNLTDLDQNMLCHAPKKLLPATGRWSLPDLRK